jgi:hypothetical protein
MALPHARSRRRGVGWLRADAAGAERDCARGEMRARERSASYVHVGKERESRAGEVAWKKRKAQEGSRNRPPTTPARRHSSCSCGLRGRREMEEGERGRCTWSPAGRPASSRFGFAQPPACLHPSPAFCFPPSHHDSASIRDPTCSVRSSTPPTSARPTGACSSLALLCSAPSSDRRLCALLCSFLSTLSSVCSALLLPLHFVVYVLCSALSSPLCRLCALCSAP